MKTSILKFAIVLFGLILFSNCENDDNDNTKSEICNNGIDDDNDGFTDCTDNDCVCEICDNGIDDDGDGFLDDEDDDCTP
ncbi:S8/S53 family peptidase [Hyunsoonleella ulvae]|uniref:hypothetical protein n=1 Tax=Hyunsoonleella ulvae TaxID=2799948 RepID=UPI00193A44C7|nr:hypothetical protein [Hyunsoonleella ulvae]